VPGGADNRALGEFSFAAGGNATASHDGSFVWADSTGGELADTAANEFVARASGGVTFYSDAAATTGVFLPPGGGAWAAVSDANAKANFSTVNPVATLELLARIPVQTWNYRSQDPSIRHMGPMAHEFYSAFGLGEDERHISTVDADGVALASIQGVYRLMSERDEEIQKLREANEELSFRLNALEKLVEELVRR
jgi:hypothetical protein